MPKLIDDYNTCLHPFSETVGCYGYSSCVLMKLIKNQFIQTDRFLLDYIELNKNNTISSVKELYPQNIEDINSYNDFLIENEFVFKFDKTERNKFQLMNLKYNENVLISNVIYDVSKMSVLRTKEVISQINNLRVKNTQLRFIEYFSFNEIKEIVLSFKNTAVRSIELYLIDDSFTEEEYNALLSIQRVSSLYVFHSTKTSIINGVTENIFYINKKNNPVDCGYIDVDFFVTNMPLFTESLHHNTCLNRKLCIDENGEIKNCPAMERSFGNIKDTTLEEAINKPGFKDLWDIKKDDIDVCKDCEFRYMCTDCRAFIKDPNNIYSQPAKCTYNPYIAKWKGQEGWISIEEWRAANPNWEKDAVRMIPGKDYYK